MKLAHLKIISAFSSTQNCSIFHLIFSMDLSQLQVALLETGALHHDLKPPSISKPSTPKATTSSRTKNKAMVPAICKEITSFNIADQIQNHHSKSINLEQSCVHFTP
jgi:hypothetical protein